MIVVKDRAISEATMAERDWTECMEPSKMLPYLAVASNRKIRLFAVACCRRISQVLPNDTCRTVIDMVEGQQEVLLRERFAELGPIAQRFLDGLLRDQRQGKSQAVKVLALLGTYARKDLLAALDRAVRFGAHSLNAIERILAAQAQPKSVLDTLAEQDQRPLPPRLSDNPVSQRPTTDYRYLVEEPTAHGPPHETDSDATALDPDEPADADAGPSA